MSRLNLASTLFGAIVILTNNGVAFSQTPFAGFTPGSLIVSRSVYAGSASTITAGQPLPPVCPATAKCNTVASDNGAYPSLNSSNNVWNNDNADGSFGITSPVFLDQYTLQGSFINTLAIPSNLVNTSFSSKSEMALNLAADGSAITFMAYIAPSNAIDVSNSNSPAAYDPTNPAGGSYSRGVVQVFANGAIQVTPTNGYSGNNGRAVMLANGYYYMAGNSNNGTTTPDNVVATTGVQIATPGQPASTPAQEIGSFSVTSVNDPTTGKPYAADKAGKDNNFRGLTIFNNTLYVTKGSGSNGINTVYQVGTSGALPTPATAAAELITILPGFPTTLAKVAGATNPFGIWFANATTLYVADEGDGTTANAAASKAAGLQKWILVNGAWQLAYVMQNGLNLGQQYSINGYPTALNPATGGLRNIVGRINGDGTVSIYAVTSTVSANGDTGADPNKLVVITDILSATTPEANEQFLTLRTAAAGEVLRGVAFAPSTSANMRNVPLIISAANYGATAVAPESLVTANGLGFAAAVAGSTTLPLPPVFGGTSVSIVDSANKSFAAPLLYVSPTQVNFLMPTGVASGTAQVTVTAADGTKSTGTVQIAPVAPGIFTLNNAGLAAAYVVRVAADGTQAAQNVYSVNSAGAIVANPISMGASTDRVYLVLFGTGLQAASTSGVTATVAGGKATVLFAGPGGGFAGLDQVNLLLPSSLAGKGNVNIQISASGIPANPVQVTIQ